ncbi:MAG: hypothetical protein ACOYMA_19045 [Bacteroidia bacterium]
MKANLELPASYSFGSSQLVGYSSDKKMTDIYRNGIIQPIFLIEHEFNSKNEPYFIIYVAPEDVEKLEKELNILINEDDSGWTFIEPDIKKAFEFREKYGWNCEEPEYKV